MEFRSDGLLTEAHREKIAPLLPKPRQNRRYENLIWTNVRGTRSDISCVAGLLLVRNQNVFLTRFFSPSDRNPGLTCTRESGTGCCRVRQAHNSRQIQKVDLSFVPRPNLRLSFKFQIQRTCAPLRECPCGGSA